MRILICGSTGLVGSALVAHLQEKGDEVLRLVRDRNALGPNDIFWDPAAGQLEADKLEGVDAVVNLAGENVATGRWTTAKKARIRDSRVKGAQLLSKALVGLRRKPQALIAASAIGFYGDRGDDLLDEHSAPGEGFLPDVCREWEAASQAAQAAQAAEAGGIRVALLRIGVVLSTRGGALAKLLTPFKLGLGGRIGHGRQYMSWITLTDLVRVIDFALNTESLRGPVNAVAPQPVTNADFAKELGRALSRPALAPLPAFVARALFGEMGETLLLAGAHVLPAKLKQAGFSFEHPDLRTALAAELAG